MQCIRYQDIINSQKNDNHRNDNQWSGLALSIGNFDGVHLGHQAILAQLHNNARAKNHQTAVMFFEPQPKEFFGQSLPRISSWQEKIMLLKQHHIDYVILADFNQTFMQQSASDFTRHLKELQVKQLLVGDDFKFGQDRRGDAHFLKQAGFDVTVLETILHHKKRISSTQIRHYLQKGDFASASQLLGRAYSITGEVVYGDQIGRSINFPTANIALNRPKPCLHGIYAVQVELADHKKNIKTLNRIKSLNDSEDAISGYSEQSLFGAANVGMRPAIKHKQSEWRLEVHIPNFQADLYGKTLTVTFLHFLHGEKDYANLTALKAGIQDDVTHLIAWRKKNKQLPFIN